MPLAERLADLSSRVYNVAEIGLVVLAKRGGHAHKNHVTLTECEKSVVASNLSLRESDFVISSPRCRR